MTLNPQFITDKKGKKTVVQLSLKECEYLIEELDMKEDIALYEKVKANKKESYMPLKEYLKNNLNLPLRVAIIPVSTFLIL